MLITLAGSDGEISVNISEYWSDQYGIGIKGWISAAHSRPDDIEFVCDDAVVPVAAWHPREDIVRKAPLGFLGKAWGFWCYLPSTSTPSVTIQRRGSKARHRHQVKLTRHPPKIADPPDTESGSLFEQFRAEMNRAPGKILEIGSRQVVAGGQSKRGLFPGCQFVGFDYYRDANTDVVGDAHELSKFFGCEFDAVFSLAVFEHLALPWVVAAEINKVLKVGGLTFHSTHFAFPPHERPWDFWRYTDQALRVLFSPPLGFQVVGCAFDTPVRLHPDTVREDLIHLPLEVAWVGVSVLARKTADIDPAKFVWSASVAECLGGESQYPAPALKTGA
jgi:SAM-dependent methyltransferase